MMKFKISEMPGNVVVIECPERLDVNVSDDLKTIMTNLTGQKKYKIVLNLMQTRYVDSSGLGAIVSRIAVTRANGGDIRLAVTSKSILDLLQLTHLNKIISSYDNLIQAVHSYSANNPKN
jgi:anti-sigma B factor antagonist